MRRAGFAWLPASLLLHAAAVAALLLAGPQPGTDAAPEMGVALLWDRQEEGAGDAEDSASLAIPDPPAAALPPSATPPATVAPPPPSHPEPPPQAPGAPPPPALPGPVAEPLPPVPAPDPVPAMPMAEALPPPPPPAPPQQQAAVTSPPARPRATLPPPRQSGPSPDPAGEAPPPQAAGAGTVLGATAPARPLAGAANVAPDYPTGSRLRGEQGRVQMVARVNPEGRVVHVAVVGSSGFPALDEAAERAVRRWRFQPEMRDGVPVFSTVPLGITFQLDGGRRW